MSLFCMALLAAFRAHKAKTDKAAPNQPDTGIVRYRRQLAVENRDKVAVFTGSLFGIFRSYELAVLGGITVRDRATAGETTETVLRRYGILPPPPPLDSS